MVAGEINRDIRALPAQGVQPVRAVRRAWSRRLRRFLDTHHEVLASRVRREVRSKLETGRKHPARRPT